MFSLTASSDVVFVRARFCLGSAEQVYAIRYTSIFRVSLKTNKVTLWMHFFSSNRKKVSELTTNFYYKPFCCPSTTCSIIIIGDTVAHSGMMQRFLMHLNISASAALYIAITHLASNTEWENMTNAQTMKYICHIQPLLQYSESIWQTERYC